MCTKPQVLRRWSKLFVRAHSVLPDCFSEVATDFNKVWPISCVRDEAEEGYEQSTDGFCGSRVEVHIEDKRTVQTVRFEVRIRCC